MIEKVRKWEGGKMRKWESENSGSVFSLSHFLSFSFSLFHSQKILFYKIIIIVVVFIICIDLLYGK